MSEVPIRYKVAEDEKIENIEIRRSKFHGGIKHLSFMPDFLTIPRPGILFITTKKIIFEKRNADFKKKYDDFEIPHTDIKKTEGKNKTLLDLTSNYAYLKIITFEGKEIQIVGIKNGKDISENLNEKYYLPNHDKNLERYEINRRKKEIVVEGARQTVVNERLLRTKAEKLYVSARTFLEYKEGMRILDQLGDHLKRNSLNDRLQDKINRAKHHEKLLEFDQAVNIYKELEMDDDTVRVRKLKAEQGAVKVTQKVVHGDEITKTEIKDSVLNRSNVGVGGDDKFTKLKELTEMKEKGFIDDDEFKQMKKEIIGK